MTRRLQRLPRLRAVMLAMGATLAVQGNAWAALAVDSMGAFGNWALDGGTPTMLTSNYSLLGGGPDPVDVLDFPGSTTSHAGLHSYGHTNGNFGSRSSGQGVYDVSGGFGIAMTIQNTSATAQNATFNFYITPGQVSNYYTALTGTQYVEAGLKFDIRRDGSSIWGSTAKLVSGAAGTTFTQGGTNLYQGSGRFYSIAGGSYQVDLGVIGAGDSINLTYALNTWAKGDAPAGDGTLVPEQTFVVPDQWVDFCGEECGYGDGYGYGEFVAGHTVTIEEHFVPGMAGSSNASSGDPFTVDFGDGSLYLHSFAVPRNGQGSVGVSFSNPVPEPATYGMLAMGLLAVGAMVRRRRAG